MNYVEKVNNKACVCGEILTKAAFSHEVYGEGFYELKVGVKRLSGQTDIIPVTVSERLTEAKKLEVGSEICATGQFRSYNKLENEHSKLMLTVFVRDFLPYDPDEQNPNLVELNGYICKPPVYRTTPFNREICDVLLAVNRGYNKSDYIPCIAWGRNARFVRDAEVGVNVIIGGRIQSRKYNKKLPDETIEERVAYELSVSKITVERNIAETASTVDPQ